MTLLSGTTLGPYEVVGPLGSGGMGEVYRTRDTRLGRQVALKLLLPDGAADQERLRRFRQEAEAAGLLNHPNVLAVFDVGTYEGTPYVVSELLEGETLRERLAGGALPPAQARDLALQIAGGLAAAHAQGIVHRDLKPENVFITRDGVAKLLDFGLAKLGPDADPAVPGTVLGTAGYMSPEQARGRPSDGRSDVFSFGVVLYEMASGRRAFPGASALEAMSAVLREEPPWPSAPSPLAAALLAVARKCLRKDPRQRYASADDLLLELRSIGVAAPVAARRRWAAAPVLGAAALLLAAAGAGYLAGARGDAAATMQRLTFRRGVVTAARFGAEPGSVVYSAEWDGRPGEVFVTGPHGPDSRPLNVGPAHLLALSRSGEMALLLRPRHRQAGVYTGTLARAPLSGGGTPRALVDDVQAADWSPDGADLAVVREVDGRARIEYPLGRLLFQTAGSASHLRVAPDGSQVAFVDHPLPGDSSGAVAVVDRAGHARTLSAGWLSVAGLAWAPSGREVWFTAARVGARRALWAVTLDGRERLVRETMGALTLHDASEQRVLLSRDDLRRETLAGGGPGEPAERSLTWLDWTRAAHVSADGGRVLFTEQGEGSGTRPSIFVRPVAGTAAVRVGEGIASELSPDGRWALALQPGPPAQLALLPLEGGRPRALTADDINRHWATWAPDGARVVFAGHREGQGVRLYVQPLAGGPPHAISPEGVRATGHPVSPDSSRVAAVGPGGGLVLYPLHEGTPAAVPGAVPSDRPFRFTHDGAALLVFQEGEVPSTVSRLDLRSGRREVVRRLMPADAAGVTQIEPAFVSEDGRRYVYSTRRVLSDLYLVEGMK